MSYSVYKIIDKRINKPIYIGKTINSLHARMHQHCNSIDLPVDKYILSEGINNFSIELIDDSATNKKELQQLENNYIIQYSQKYKLFNQKLEHKASITKNQNNKIYRVDQKIEIIFNNEMIVHWVPIYIGQTRTTLTARLASHNFQFKGSLYKVMNNLSYDNFKIILLQQLNEQDDVNFYETQWILKYQYSNYKLYNKNIGKYMTSEARKKQSQIISGNDNKKDILQEYLDYNSISAQFPKLNIYFIYDDQQLIDYIISPLNQEEALANKNFDNIKKLNIGICYSNITTYEYADILAYNFKIYSNLNADILNITDINDDAELIKLDQENIQNNINIINNFNTEVYKVVLVCEDDKPCTVYTIKMERIKDVLLSKVQQQCTKLGQVIRKRGIDHFSIQQLAQFDDEFEALQFNCYKYMELSKNNQFYYVPFRASIIPLSVKNSILIDNYDKILSECPLEDDNYGYIYCTTTNTIFITLNEASSKTKISRDVLRRAVHGHTLYAGILEDGTLLQWKLLRKDNI